MAKETPVCFGDGLDVTLGSLYSSCSGLYSRFGERLYSRFDGIYAADVAIVLKSHLVVILCVGASVVLACGFTLPVPELVGSRS